ncbi:hypothetical protein GP486_006839 [Trichoglossum hirsutum]|uniref:Rhamnogalacturonase A/B/Epimerase-like pectate lyase domain-containing protein n=1 Tax=Trichoglossum hirsutum TaxID=265104 RepID=A0A9P8ICV3_9PEZI|nr:hypothetical protein GP486_006839 [Trichoglossum hirsutum]
MRYAPIHLFATDTSIDGWFAWSTDTTSLDDGGTTIVPAATPRMGCWKRIFQGSLSVKWFGALGDGVDDNDAVEAAVIRANSLNVPVFFPSGTYRVKYIGLYSKTVLIGAGKEQTIIRQTSGSTGALVGQRADVSGVLQYCSIRDLKLLGNEGAGGTGLCLDSFAHCVFESLVISTFRKKTDRSGVGLKLINSTGGTHTNNFLDLIIADCDTGLLMDPKIGVTTACAYNRFFGLKIYQEWDCIVLKNSDQTNGSKYNIFSGVLLQGTALGNTGVYCEGSSNTFLNFVVDGVPGNHIELRPEATGNVFLNPSVTPSQVVNLNTKGGQNTIYGPGIISGGLKQPFVLSDVLNGQTTVSLRASGPLNGPEIRLATDTSSDMWHFAVQHGGESAFLSLANQNQQVEQWRTDRSSIKYGDLTVNGDVTVHGHVQIRDSHTGALYRLDVKDGALGVELSEG